MTFRGVGDGDAAPTFAERIQEGVNNYATPLRYVSLLALFMLAWALLFRPMQKQFAASLKELGTGNRTSIMSLTASNAPELAADGLDHLLEADSNTVGLKKRVTEMVQTEPVAMARTLQTWLQEPEG
jgi:flagellar biosynthesis/type III secretory pathway M-ring protein FliF/YscJ